MHETRHESVWAGCGPGRMAGNGGEWLMPTMMGGMHAGTSASGTHLRG